MEIPARPFGEVLTEGMRLLAKVWRTLIPPAFGAFIALGAATVIFFRVTQVNELLDLILNDPGAIDLLSDEELAEIALRLFSAASLLVAMQWVGSAFVALATHRTVGVTLAGTTITATEASRFAARKMIPALTVSAIAIIGVLAGLILFVIPGIWIVFSLSMVLPAVALEEAGPAQALKRSFQLVKGRWWPTAGFLLLVGLLGSIAGQMVQLVALPLLTIGDLSIGLGLAFVIVVVVQGLIVAAIAVMVTVWYVDLRARKEALTTSSLV